MKITRGLAAFPMILASAPAAAAGQVDPQGSGPIVAALMWLQGTLLGNVATAVAVIAVAMVGFMMLTGRMNWRFGATVIIGGDVHHLGGCGRRGETRGSNSGCREKKALEWPFGTYCCMTQQRRIKQQFQPTPRVPNFTFALPARIGRDS
jgi:type IV secretion system protein VirB2